MKLFNKTKNVVVFDDVLVLRTIKEKTDGMLAFKTPRPIYFETRWGIHTFGVSTPIDVVVLDADGAVASFKKNTKPSRFFFWNPKYKRILELPPTDKISSGDMLELIG
jgi:uncharacterized membrane protein (UPF0127 family)